MMFPSWGGYPKVTRERALNVSRNIFRDSSGPLLPRGAGLSYGDVCLFESGTLALTRQLDHFISFDPENGFLECESGITLDEILKTTVGKGWFLPVLPGTKYVTIGGAIANDIHGKNHHHRGTIGCHVLSLMLLRSSNEILECTPHNNSDLFISTIGGIGLTGIILSVKLKLLPITSINIIQEQIPFQTLEDFLRLSLESAEQFEYTAAWVDSLSGEAQRGIFLRGNHSSEDNDLSVHSDESKLTVPFYFPNWVLNSTSIRAFNCLYYYKNILKKRKSTVDYDTFITPLDRLLNWNRIYGDRGFLQYQYVVPLNDSGIQATKEIFQIFKKNQLGSFLSVLKVFGKINSPGLMSFPMPGLTVALDVPFLGEKMFSAMKLMDEVVAQVGGRVYPAKDARMSAKMFHRFYPAAGEFSKYIDPKISSNFRQRVEL